MSAVISQGDNGIRPMKAADLDEVMAIETRLYDFPWTKGIFYDCMQVGYSCWVYQENEQIVSYGVMSAGAGEAHILTLCVRPDAQRQGYGRMLLGHMLDAAHSHKAETMLLEVRTSNRAAISLYQKTGFSEVGIRAGYYPAVNGREDAIIMALDLKNYFATLPRA